MWQTIHNPLTNVAHVIPVGDLKPHVESASCPCRPKTESVNGVGYIVVHKAWDRREELERLGDKT